MAEEKKRGFHALEQRIHDMEEEDAKQKAASGQREQERPRTEPTERRQEPAKKK